MGAPDEGTTNAKILKRNMEPLERAIAVASKSLGAKNDQPRKLITLYTRFRIS